MSDDELRETLQRLVNTQDHHNKALQNLITAHNTSMQNFDELAQMMQDGAQRIAALEAALTPKQYRKLN